MSEYRGWISIPNLPYEGHEDQWEAVIAAAERDRPDLGPIISWSDPTTATIVLSDDAEDEATAARMFMSVVADALREAGQGHLYPARVELEPVHESELEPA